MDTDRLLFHLDNWARWMKSRGLSGFHVRAKSVGVGYTHYDTDRESEYEKSDNWHAENTDAVIRDLKRLEQLALQCEYLGAIWTDPLDIGLVLVVAREGVRMGLDKRGIY